MLFKIAVVAEVTENEDRVALLPSAVKVLANMGAMVFYESGAAKNLGISDDDYKQAGAFIIKDRKELFSKDLVVKIKAPKQKEWEMMKDNSIFAMIHPPNHPYNLDYMDTFNVTGIVAEEIVDDAGIRQLNALAMTGEIAVLYATRFLKKMPQDCKALVLGYGNTATGAISMLSKLGFDYKIVRRSDYAKMDHLIKGVDMLINGIWWTPEQMEEKDYIVTREMIRKMHPFGVVVDLVSDDIIPIETCRSTYIDRPFYEEEGRIHTAVYGWPGLVPLSCCKLYSEQILKLLVPIVENRGLKDIEKHSDIGRWISKALYYPGSRR